MRIIIGIILLIKSNENLPHGLLCGYGEISLDGEAVTKNIWIRICPLEVMKSQKNDPFLKNPNVS